MTAMSATRSRLVVAFAVIFAVAFRLPGLWWPAAPDEAGFLLVARSWTPRPESMYGFYWVDRPPSLIAVFKLADALGGIVALRVVAMAAVALSVVQAAEIARRTAGVAAAAWTAVMVAGAVSNPMIDPIAAQGEILGVPFVLGSILAGLTALERRSWRWALAAGVVGSAALGLKQNLAGGLVYCGILFLGAWLYRRVSRAESLRMCAGLVAGSLVPPALTVVWAVSAGVHLSVVWESVIGFRSDSLAVILSSDVTAHFGRASLLLAIFVISGMGLVMVSFLLRYLPIWRVTPHLASAALAIGLYDTLGLALSGSYWRPYLLPLIPAMTVACALLVKDNGAPIRAIAMYAMVASLWAIPTSGFQTASGWDVYAERATGEGIGAASEPGDTLFIYGGRANIQLASGLDSTYPYLWSLPMRTLDPSLDQVNAMLAGENPPTWIVASANFDAWSQVGHRELIARVGRDYTIWAVDCQGDVVYLRNGIDRPVPNVC